MNEMDFAFSILKHIARSLGIALGQKYEVVLHDVRNPESSIVEIVNGELTGRRVGDSSTNLALPVLKDPYGDHDAFHYRSTTRTGKTLRSSSMYLKDPTGRVFAALCINHDISELMSTVSILREMIEIESTDSKETFVTNIDDVISRILDETVNSLSRPIDQMTREDKLKLIQTLDEKGVFTVKRSIDRVATMLGISRVTVYGYINEAQTLRDSNLS